MKAGAYTATGRLLKLYLRGSRVITLFLILLPFLFAYSAAKSNMALLQTPEQLNSYIAENQGNVLLGSIAANTVAGVTVWRIRLSTAIIASILSIVLVLNHTRKDEEQGRLELLRAGAIGSKAPLTAALMKAFGANILGGLAMALGFLAAGFSVAGSFAAGFSTALANCAFAVLAAIAAQIAPNARLARGLSLGVMAFLIIVSAIANSFENETLLLFTPFGWCAYARPYAGENFLLFPFAVVFIALLIYTAYALSGKRDMGGSYISERRGRAQADKCFKNTWTLAWRLQKGMLLVWVATYALMGTIIASLAPSISNMLSGTSFLPELSKALGGPGSAFLAILSYILTQVLTAYAIMAILRMRDEETAARTELVLSASASRIRYALGHICVAFLGSAAALFVFGATAGNLASSMARLPAIWIIASASVFLYGILPRAAAPVSWGLFGGLLLLEFLWEMRLVGNTIFALSPFSWVYPGISVTFLPVFVMTSLSVILLVLGVTLFSRRDLVGE